MTPAEDACSFCGAERRPWLDGLFDDRHGHPGRYRIDRCLGCSAFALRPAPSPAELPGLYRDRYPRSVTTAEQVRQGARGQGRRARLGAWLRGTRCAHDDVAPGERVLDVGCGAGGSLVELRARGAEAVGLEVDPAALPIARELGVDVRLAPVAELPADLDGFDAITLSQVIEHTPDPVDLMRRLAARLRPGGRLVFTAPNPDGLTRRLLGRRWLHWHVPYHLHHLGARAWDHAAARAGLALERRSTFTPLAWWGYQASLLLAPPAEGVRHIALDGRPRPPRSLRERLAAHPVVRDRLCGVATALLAPAARVLDLLGLGDATVVVARRPG